MIKIICKNVVLNKTYVSFIEENDDSTLLEICQQAEGMTPSIIFEKYYTYFTFHLMHNESVLPYVYSNDILEWNVPYSQVCLRDFLLTHNINKGEGIYVESGLPLAGGIGLPDFALLWDIVSPYVLGIISTGADVGGFTSLIFLIMQSWRKKKRMPTPHTFFEVILKEKWNYRQLAKQLHIENESQKAKDLLKFLGYEWLPKEQLYYLPRKKIRKAKKLLHSFDELKFKQLIDKQE
jgi:hypothetical protein